MPPESARYLQDMLNAARTIDERVAGVDGTAFLQTGVVRDAATWNLCVTGDALSQLLKLNEGVERQITGHRKIVGLRNQLIHGYGVINPEVTWRIVTDHLRVLRAELEQLLTT